MIICVCNNVSDKTIEKIVIEHDVINIKELQAHIPACDQCKRCGESMNCLIKTVLMEKLTSDRIAA